MKNNRSGEIHYSSFQELAESMGLKKPFHNNKRKTEYQQEQFGKRHKCKACGQSLTFVGGNIITCTNPKCRGIKNARKLEDGTEITTYTTSYELLDEIGEKIAGRIFKD